jgi:predicted O-methyltransferase YrrM
MVVYPEGIWYSGVQPEDAAEIVEEHFVHGRIVERLANSDAAALRAEAGAHRDRMSERLRRKDAAGTAPDQLLQTIRGFQESRVILTALELDIFSATGNGAGTEEVARRIHADPRATGMLLNALTAMGLLTKRDGRFADTPVAARFLAAQGQNDVRAELLSTELWSFWSKLTDAVRAGTAVGYEARDEDWTEAFIAAMYRGAMERAGGVIGALGVSGVRRMLDVGGGSGGYSIAFAKANSELTADVLDLPTVIPYARRYCAAADVEDRVRVVGGDLSRGPFGAGYDLVFVSSVCHIFSESQNRELLQRCFEACAPGGRVAIHDYLLEPDKTAPKTAAMFALTMLVATAEGSNYSEAEYSSWLSSAGFEGIHSVRPPGPFGLVVGVRPVAR